MELLTFSSDLVFDGHHQSPYVESSPVRPLNVYGRSKMEGEQLVLSTFPEALVIRTSSFFGSWDEHNFVIRTLRDLSRGERVNVVSDVKMSPTYVPDLVHVCLDLLIDHERGVLHLSNDGEVSWSSLARMAHERALRKSFGSELGRAEIVERPLSEMNWPAPRPLYSALSSERVRLLPPLDDAIDRCFDQLEVRLPL
jgi:dTDP-4-dehydrorhamnose reductase